MAIWDTIGRAADYAYSSYNKIRNAWNTPTSKTTSNPKTNTTTPSGFVSGGYSTAADAPADSGIGQKYYADLLRQLASLESTPAPTLPEYKPMDYSFEQAMSEAAPSVNTYYDKTLQDYLKTVETRKVRTAEDLATANANYDTQGRYLGEDYSTNLANLATGAKLSGQGEAATATANRGATQGALAGAGLTFSGLGQEKLNQQDVARRLSLAAATAQLNQAKGAAETTKTRGMEAIGTGKKAATTAATRTEQDLAAEQEEKRTELEYNRAADIASKASQLYQQQQAAWNTSNPYWASILGG